MMKYWNSLLRLEISLCKGGRMAYSLDDIFIDSIFEAKELFINRKGVILNMIIGTEGKERHSYLLNRKKSHF